VDAKGIEREGGTKDGGREGRRGGAACGVSFEQGRVKVGSSRKEEGGRKASFLPLTFFRLTTS